MGKLYIGLIMEAFGAMGVLTFPLAFIMTFHKRYIVLTLASITVLGLGFLITVL